MHTTRKLVCGAAVLAALVTQPLAGSAATLPTNSLPGVTTPSVTVPSITTQALPVATPKITVPTATVPTVTVPSVHLPSVTTPTITTPAGTVPSVTTPSVSTPPVSSPTVSVPRVTTPRVTAPSLSSSGSGAAGAPAANSGSTSPASTPSATSGNSTTGSGSSTAAASAVAAAAHRSEHRSTGSSGQAAERAENRRLRTLVDSDRGCLGSLDAQSQRLLSLRAGLHGVPRSATAVARILHVTPAREQLLEQMSLVALRSTASSGCAGHSAAIATPAVSEMTASAPWITPTPTYASSSAGTVTATGSSSATAPGSGHSRHSTTKPIVITQAANTQTAEREGTASDPLSAIEIALFAIVVLAAALLLMPGVRRRLLPVLAGVPAADGLSGRTAPRATGATASVATPVPTTPPSTADGFGSTADAPFGAGAGAIAAGSAGAVASRPDRNGSSNGATSRWDAFATRPRATPAARPETADSPADESPAPAAPAAPAEFAAHSDAPAASHRTSASPALTDGQPGPSAVEPRGQVKPSPKQSGPKVEPQRSPSPDAGPSTRPAMHWLREHATQGALVATVVAGGLARILRRGRR